MDMPTPLRVLIAEATPEGAYDVLEELRRAGHDPFAQVVANAEEMEVLLAVGTWHVLIGDAELPGLGPAAAMGVLRNRGLDLPLIALARGSGEEPAVEAIRAGACDYLRRDRLEKLGPAVAREVGAAADRRLHRERLLQAGGAPTLAALASALRHELNNPLAAIIANLSYLREELAALKGRALPPPAGKLKDLDEALSDTLESANRIRDVASALGGFKGGD
ncbi:MAG TPA: histidine kinase dimerization/phospho-acceptor domain-containing protein [Myxococcaceae bacterium]|jgi:CheY-like chemotaxis protein